LLRLDVVAPTTNPVTSIPSSFAPLNPWNEADVDVSRDMVFTLDTNTLFASPVEGPFLINNAPFDMDSINVTCFLDEVEIWRLINQTELAHPFHIHDIQFYVLDVNGNPPAPGQHGQKDVVLVMPGDTVRFITQFERFAHPTDPYMFHCHILHHEDEGMMGHFLVIDTNAVSVPEIMGTQHISVSPNPSSDIISIGSGRFDSVQTLEVEVYNILGQKVQSYLHTPDNLQVSFDVSKLQAGLYTVVVRSIHKQYSGKFLKI
jgi:bilirubin oxidase